MNFRILFYGFWSICCLFAPIGCQKMTDDNLYGSWQQIRQTRLTDGAETDMRDARVYWNFQLGLVFFRWVAFDKEYGNTIERFSYYIHRNDSLLMNALYVNRRTSDSLIVTPATEDLQPFGLPTWPAHYRIVRQEGDVLMLQDETYLLEFRRY